MKFTHTCLVTKDIKKLADFYKSILQVEPKFFGDNYAEFSFEGMILSIFSFIAQEELAPGSVSEINNKSAMFEFNVDNVDGEFSRLKNMGVNFVKPLTTQPWGNKSFYFRDPDGNLLNFYTKVAV